jgi:hypothetical protein
MAHGNAGGRRADDGRVAPAPRGRCWRLTTGKLNAVRTAFKAGVRTSAIARQFGISQADLKKPLAVEGRKAGR